MLLYGLDDLALIESTCLHYPKNQKLSFSLFSNYGGNTTAMAQILDTLGFMGRVYEKFILKHM